MTLSNMILAVAAILLLITWAIIHVHNRIDELEEKLREPDHQLDVNSTFSLPLQTGRFSSRWVEFPVKQALRQLMDKLGYDLVLHQPSISTITVEKKAK